MTGSGTLLDPYVIWDVNDLQDMNLDLTAYYELIIQKTVEQTGFKELVRWV